jgi:hypothetical protein
LEDTAVKIDEVTLGFHMPFFLCLLLYEFGFAFFEFFLACYAAKMVGFAFIRDFILGRVFI